MPRLIILLLTSAALTTLALQNLGEESAVPVVIAGQTLVEGMPLGLLLLLSVAVGSLLTLILYGLVGLIKPAESKYRPMGRRVPYPSDSSSGPSSSTSGPSGSPTPQDSAPNRYAGSSSSAFVSEPSSRLSSSPPPADSKPDSRPDSQPVDAPGSGAEPAPFIMPPEDTPPDTGGVRSHYQGSYSAQDYDPAYPSDVYAQSGHAQSGPRSDAQRESSYREYSDSEYSDADYSESEYLDPSFSASQPPDASRLERTNSKQTKRRFIEEPIAGIKSVFGKKKDQDNSEEIENRPIGDDWGELRTTAQRNSWNLEKEDPLSLEEGAKNLFQFGRNVGANASRLAEDIASGWNEQSASNRAYSTDDGYSQYPESQYLETDSDLDSGWQAADDYRESPRYSAADKRTYGESLYGSASDGLDGAYPADDFDDGLDEVGPDDVYEADYRVIEPPTKSLSEIDPETTDLRDDDQLR